MSVGPSSSIPASASSSISVKVSKELFTPKNCPIPCAPAVPISTAPLTTSPLTILPMPSAPRERTLSLPGSANATSSHAKGIKLSIMVCNVCVVDSMLENQFSSVIAPVSSSFFKTDVVLCPIASEPVTMSQVLFIKGPLIKPLTSPSSFSPSNICPSFIWFKESIAGVDANRNIVSHVPRKLISKSPICVRIKLGLKYHSPVDSFCRQGTKSVSSPSIELMPTVSIVPIPINDAMYFLITACSKEA